jgi:hypothetical protein
MSFIKLNIKTQVRYTARVPQARLPLNDEWSWVLYDILSNLHIKYIFFTNKINFDNLGNFVTVGAEKSREYHSKFAAGNEKSS